MIIKDDNFLSKEQQIDFINKILGPRSIIDKWRPHHLLETFDVDKDGLDLVVLRHPLTLKLYNKYNFQIAADLMEFKKDYDLFIKIFDLFCKKNNIEYEDITKARVVILPPSPYSTTYNNPHVDQISDHKVFIYYFNNSDGNTVIFNETVLDNQKEAENYQNHRNGLSIKEKIIPKMGLGVTFSGIHYHASSPPINTQARCILNLNYTLKKNKSKTII